MKKPAIYFLLIVYLLSFSEVRQMMKLPNLVEHYIFHKISNGSTTLFSFVKMHYLDGNVVDSDYEQDMKLPFKSHESNIFSTVSLLLPGGFQVDFQAPEIMQENVVIFSYSPKYASNPLASVFHPPILV